MTSWKTFAIGGAVGVGAILALKKYCGGPMCTYSPSLKGQLAVVTGANTGIGYETALRLAELGATVVIAVRDIAKGEAAIASMKAHSGPALDLVCMQLDLASLESIRAFAQEFESRYNRCNILINNAGVMMCPYMQTRDGFEMQFGTNHLGHFLLTNLLLPVLCRSKARVVNLSSYGHTMAPPCGIEFDNLNPGPAAYSSTKAYGQSKLANILFTKELQRRHGTDISVYAVHPGAVRTELTRHFNGVLLSLIAPIGWVLLKSPIQGAQTSLHCALAPEGHLPTQVQPGLYYQDCHRQTVSSAANDADLAKKLWSVSADLVKL